MKVLLDTNVVLDAIAAREPFKEAAQGIILLAAEDKVVGFITANCLTDIYYIARKSMSDADAREALHNLFLVFNVIGLLGTDCEEALNLAIDDYEDAVAVVCARKANVEYIITRDEEFLRAASKPSAISPQDFLKKLKR
jgi:predicted nucleic acid-binding protein